MVEKVSKSMVEKVSKSIWWRKLVSQYGGEGM